MTSSTRPIVIAGGGTAGHILPGLSIAEALIAMGHDRSELLWVGSQRGQEATLLPPTGIEYVLLPGRGIQRRLAPENIGAVAGLLSAMVQAFFLVARRRPAVVLTLGGYASVAASFAAVLWRVPVVVAEQNAVGGAANRFIGRFAVACAVPVSGTGLPREVVTGNPVRDRILELRPASPDAAAASKAAAREAIEIDPNKTLIVSFAGSLGSRRINEAIVGLVEQWSERSDIAVYHVVGRRDFAQFDAPTPPNDGLIYRVVEYEERMDLVLAAADVVVSRGGGTTVAELAVMGVPSVLVPLPIAPGDHQRFNAQSLVTAGAARLVDDAECTGDTLRTVLSEMIDVDGALDEMASAAWNQGRPNAAAAVAAVIDAQLPTTRRLASRD